MGAADVRTRFRYKMGLLTADFETIWNLKPGYVSPNNIHFENSLIVILDIAKLL